MNYVSCARFAGSRSLRWKSPVLVALVAAVIAGCGTTKVGTAKDSQAALLERATKRWNALVQSDIRTAYSYLSPGSRQVVSYEAYVTSIRPGFWKKAEVKRADCSEAAVCDVVVEIEYDYKGMRIKTPLREPWALTDGEWWFVSK